MQDPTSYNFEEGIQSEFANNTTAEILQPSKAENFQQLKILQQPLCGFTQETKFHGLEPHESFENRMLISKNDYRIASS